MTASAIVMMIIGILIIWGGFAASVLYAISKSRQKAKQEA